MCLLARHQVSAIAVTLPSSLSPFLFLSLSLFSLSGRRKKTFKGKNRVHRNGSCVLFAAAWLTPKKSSFLLYSFFMSFSPFGPVPRLVLSMVEQAADSPVTSVEDEQWREGGRGTNERDIHSRGLSPHL